MSKNGTTVQVGGGIGFCGLLTLIFITLKLCHVIDWHWLWVLSPILISFTLGMCFMLFAICIVLLAAIVQAWSGR